MTTKRLYAAAVFVGMVGVAVLAQSSDPLIGTWKLNAAKSKGELGIFRHLSPRLPREMNSLLAQIIQLGGIPCDHLIHFRFRDSGKVFRHLLP